MSLTQMSLHGAILILAVSILRLFALDKLPKWSFLLLWDVALARLLLPFRIPSQISVFRFVPSEPSPLALTVNQAVSEIAQQSQTLEYAGKLPLLRILWLAVTFSLAVLFAVGYFKSWRKLRFATRIAGDPALEGHIKAYRLARPLSVLETDRTQTPLSIGILHPRIILPKCMDRTNTQLLHHVLLHEYVHIRRFDSLRKLLVLCAVCVHWFNPAVWLMLVLANRDLELSCDEQVLRRLGFDAKKGYAYSLLQMSQQRNRISFVYCAFSKNTMKERVISIMKAKKHSLLITMLALVLVLGITTAFATTASADRGPLNMNSASDVSELLDSTVYKEFVIGGHGLDLFQADAGSGIQLQTNNGDVVCLYNHGGAWSLSEGQTVSIDALVPNAAKNSINIGYILVDGSSSVKAEVLVQEQIYYGKSLLFTAPESGDYYFFFTNFSSGRLTLATFLVN